MAPAPVRHCRVLEIGCAGGANLVSMAFGLPESTFVGIDLSARQIAAAQAFADELGLTNVDLRAMDLMDVTSELGSFDYVIAHGLHSWVPAHVREQLFVVCRDNLAPHGVASVSHNTLPGWHMLGIVRDMMRYRTRHVSDPAERARLARPMLVRLHAATPASDRSAFASFIATYVKVRFGRFGGHEAWEDSTLLHDELGEFNDPVYLHELVEQASGFGLQYLADAKHPQTPASDLPPATARLLGELAGDVIEQEQYLDFARHRTFRRTLLCHDAVTLDRDSRVAALGELHVTAWPLDDEAGDDPVTVTDDPLTVAALELLRDMAPQPVLVRALLADACRRAGGMEPDAAALVHLSAGLLAAAASDAGGVQLRADSPSITVQPSERPCLSPVARCQLRHAPFVSTLLHEQLELRGLDVAVASLLDGRRTRDDLRAELLAQVDSGRLHRPGGAELDRDIDRSLGRLGRAGLLLT